MIKYEEYIEKYLDGTLSANEECELTAWLSESEENRRCFCDYVGMDSLLAASVSLLKNSPSQIVLCEVRKALAVENMERVRQRAALLAGVKREIDDIPVPNKLIELFQRLFYGRPYINLTRAFYVPALCILLLSFALISVKLHQLSVVEFLNVRRSTGEAIETIFPENTTLRAGTISAKTIISGKEFILFEKFKKLYSGENDDEG